VELLDRFTCKTRSPPRYVPMHMTPVQFRNMKSRAKLEFEARMRAIVN
jgi:hypothetical protein